MTGVWSRLRQRKVVEWAVAYLAGAWLALQVLSIIAESFAWPSWIMRASIILGATGFLIAVIVAWFHGERGHQRIGILEAVVLAAVITLGAVGGVYAWRRSAAQTAQPIADERAAATSQRSIAVLPFANLSDDKSNEYFSDGITDDLLTQLSRIGQLRVISRSSVMRYKSTDQSAPAIAAELGVDHLLQGSVRRTGNRVRVSAQLIRADRDQQIWAEAYDRELKDLFAVQTEIARAIATALETQLNAADSARVARKPTNSMDAYDRFLRARESYLTITQPGFERSITLLQEALRIDPDFALAEAWLARGYTLRSRWAGPEWLDSAQVVAQRAIRRDSTMTDGYTALGDSFRERGKLSEALRYFHRALRLEPNNALTILQIGEANGPQGLGNLDVAIPWLRRAVQLDPASVATYVHLAEAHRMLGQPAEARAWLDRALRIDSRYRGLRLWLAVLEADQGNWNAAQEQLEALLVMSGRPHAEVAVNAALATALGNRALATDYALELPDSALRTLASSAPRWAIYLFWLRGNRAEAARVAVEQENSIKRVVRAGSEDPGDYLELAEAAGARGAARETLEYLERYIDAGGRDIAVVSRNLLFEAARAHPQYQALHDRLAGILAQQRARLAAARPG